MKKSKKQIKQEKAVALKEEGQLVARKLWFKRFFYTSLIIYFFLLLTSLISFNYSILTDEVGIGSVSEIFLNNWAIILILSGLFFLSLAEAAYFYFRIDDLSVNYSFMKEPWWNDKFKALGFSLIVTLILIVLPPILGYSFYYIFFKNWKILLGIVTVIIVITAIVYWFKLNKKLSKD